MRGSRREGSKSDLGIGLGFFCGLNSAKTPLGTASHQAGALSHAAVPRSKLLVHWPCVPFDWLEVLLWEATGFLLDKGGNFGHSSCSLSCTGAVLPVLPVLPAGLPGALPHDRYPPCPTLILLPPCLAQCSSAVHRTATQCTEQHQILWQAAARHVVPLLHCPARSPSSLAILICCLWTETMVC